MASGDTITVTAIEPAFDRVLAMQGNAYPGVNRTVDFSITGSGFSRVLVDAVQVDGIACEEVLIESAGTMKCMRLPAPIRWSDPVAVSLHVDLCCGLGAINAGNIVRSYPNPEIVSVLSTSLTPQTGGVVRVTGAGFGEEPGVATAVSVCGKTLPRVDDCSSLVHVSTDPSFCWQSG